VRIVGTIDRAPRSTASQRRASGFGCLVGIEAAEAISSTGIINGLTDEDSLPPIPEK